MKRLLCCVVTLPLLLAADKDKDDSAKKDLAQLEGTWTTVSIEYDGKSFDDRPAAMEPLHTPPGDGHHETTARLSGGAAAAPGRGQGQGRPGEEGPGPARRHLDDGQHRVQRQVVRRPRQAAQLRLQGRQ